MKFAGDSSFAIRGASGQHFADMAKDDENVLVVKRALFDELGAFEGLRSATDRYLEAFLKRENNTFLPRSVAEDDPTHKQLIPYAVFTHAGKILHYVRGSKSGEKRLVAKGSIGIGGHINDGDESLFAFDGEAYRAAVRREIEEELRFSGGYQDRVAALINDDSNEVGRVHLGVVHIVTLENADVSAGEKAIAELQFFTPEELRARRDALETWSQIVLDAWETL
jgi:predicted NUDIX family phosphoesterase